MKLKFFNKKTWSRVTSLALATVMSLPLVSGLASCGDKNKRDNIVLMSEELSGLFNPFYATAGADMEVIGLTQIGMLSSDKLGQPVAGDEYATVVKDFKTEVIGSGEDLKTIYTFVIKNGLKFSDGKPLTMNDVFFNMYVLLDPVYTGPSSMQAIKIEGLSKYRLQRNTSDKDAESEMASTADEMAELRLGELIDLYQLEGETKVGSGSYSMTAAQVATAINSWEITDGYMEAVATEAEMETLELEDYRAMLLADYNRTGVEYRKELENDFNAAKDSFDLTTAPYADKAEELSNDIFKFFLYEGEIQIEYEKVNGKTDRTKIKRFTGKTDVSGYTRETAIEYLYNKNMTNYLHQVLSRSGTAMTLRTEYAAKATEIILQGNKNEDGSLKFKSIDGIQSLGHHTAETKVTINEKSYPVARTHNSDGTPQNANEYDVLQITVDGTDPKAIFNFGFTVAPAHYYGSVNGTGTDVDIDITQHKYGVQHGDSDFQSKVIQAQRNQEVPVGAGAYMATDANNSDSPRGDAFWSSNIVYYKANPNFMGGDPNFKVKTQKLRLQVVSSSNALDKLEQGEVDYVTPQFTTANYNRLKDMKKDGFETREALQLGYGYIGINAGEVPDMNIRKAIMSAMETQLATEFYAEGTCVTIDWPMSRVSWAYPYDDNHASKLNGHDYATWTGVVAAKQKINDYMKAAGINSYEEAQSDERLKLTFTIAGASITDHPTYMVFKQAAEILNELGWNVEVKPDAQALTKLATGSLAVWAAAWGSASDPDMYQVYHKNSSASSVLAWGYRKMLKDTTTYKKEIAIINKLSEKIDEARSSLDRGVRTPLYEVAMGYVLDLAVELPVYQRMTLYAFNANRLKGLVPQEQVDSYTSPIDKIWELELIQE